MRRLTLAFALAIVWAVNASVLSAEFTPIVIVYDKGMPDLAQGVAALLEAGSSGGEEYLVATDPSAVSALLSLPNVRCVVLTSVSSTDLVLLEEPMVSYFENGGSAIGFHGSSWQNQVGDLARDVFPAYGNSTGVGARKDGLNVNEYVAGERIAGIGDDLPDEFDMVGQFFALPRDDQRNILEPTPPEGRKTVLYRDKKTEAPLVVAYEGPSGARSVIFTGLFLRDSPNAGNHYEKLLEQAEFRSLLLGIYDWAAEGNPRFEEFSQTYQAVVDGRQEEDSNLVSRSEERLKSQKTRRALLLVVFWVAGLVGIAGLVYWSFVRTSHGP
jgi:hypothetical protein